MRQKPRIKFYCRSFNKELYTLSRRLYEEAGYPCVRLTDQTADGYFFRMLEDEECDIAINVDEDCFITDLEAVLALALRVSEEGLINAGCSDAGPGVPRKGDPSVTNPFFNVFNLRLIRRNWNAYRLIPELRKDSYKGLEPYYNFFHWLVRTFPDKTLYLDNRRHRDGVSTILCGSDPSVSTGSDVLCVHSWFARQFNPGVLSSLFEGNDKKGVDHRSRINSLIDEAYAVRGLKRPGFGPIERLLFWIDEMIRWSVKIPQRIMNWPNKLKKHFVS